MFEALKFISAVICADLRRPNRAPDCEGESRPAILSDCREPLALPPLLGSSNGGCGASRSEQNPQVPLASEDAFAQVPGNAETPPCGGATMARSELTSTAGGIGPHGAGEMPGHSLSRPAPAAADFAKHAEWELHRQTVRLRDDLLSGRAYEDGNSFPQWATDHPVCQRCGTSACICAAMQPREFAEPMEDNL